MEGRKQLRKKPFCRRRGTWGGEWGDAAALGGGGDASCGSMGLREAWRTPPHPYRSALPSSPAPSLCCKRAAMPARPSSRPPSPQLAPPPREQPHSSIHPRSTKPGGGGGGGAVHPSHHRTPRKRSPTAAGGGGRTEPHQPGGGGRIVAKLQSAFSGEGRLMRTPPLLTHTPRGCFEAPPPPPAIKGSPPPFLPGHAS